MHATLWWPLSNSTYHDTPPRAGWFWVPANGRSAPVTMIGEMFGHHNHRLRASCLQVRPVTCWHPPGFLYWIGVYFIKSSQLIGNFSVVLKFNRLLVRDVPNLLDDSGEIPKSQGRGWQFDSQLWNLLSTWQNTGQVVNCLLCFGIALSTFFLYKIKKKNQNFNWLFLQLNQFICN